MKKPGNCSRNRSRLRESIAVVEEMGDKGGRAASLHALASLEAEQGQYEEARRLLRESIVVEEEIGDRAGLAVSLIHLGQLDVRLGQFEQGRRRVQQGIDLFEALDAGDLDQARTILRNIDSLAGPPSAPPRV